jgi:hypothetical protein
MTTNNAGKNSKHGKDRSEVKLAVFEIMMKRKIWQKKKN